MRGQRHLGRALDAAVVSPGAMPRPCAGGRRGLARRAGASCGAGSDERGRRRAAPPLGRPRASPCSPLSPARTATIASAARRRGGAGHAERRAQPGSVEPTPPRRLLRSRSRAGKPAAAHSSISCANSGSGAGVSSSRSSSVKGSGVGIAGLSQLLDDSVKAGAGVGLARADDARRSRHWRARRRTSGRPGRAPRARASRARRGRSRAGAPAPRAPRRTAGRRPRVRPRAPRAASPAELVERGVAGDAEQPGVRRPRRGLYCAACGRRARTPAP